MALSTAQLSLIEQRVANDGPNPVAAYLLWFFLGLFGAHRFYLGRTGSAVAQLLLTITVIGLFVSCVWVLIDVFLIEGMMRENREAIRQRMMTQFLATDSGGPTPAVAPPVPEAPAVPAAVAAVAAPVAAEQAPLETPAPQAVASETPAPEQPAPAQPEPAMATLASPPGETPVLAEAEPTAETPRPA
jgi:TM2 domain-containing membrane protein YozV